MFSAFNTHIKSFRKKIFFALTKKQVYKYKNEHEIDSKTMKNMK